MTNKARSHGAAITDRCEKLSEVESCLSGLYARAMEHQGAVPTVKTVLPNLIIYAPDAQAADKAMDYASGLLPLVPCRAIIAEIVSSQPADGAVVAVMCGITERGNRRLCGEVINVHALRGAVTGAVMPLLLPDVPVYLWVLGDIPPEGEDFDDLLGVSSHVIADSREFTDLARGLRACDKLRSPSGGHRVVQDLSWVSLRHWREATAEHFDAPAVRQHLAELREATVAYSAQDKSPLPASAPLLFASWFVERMELGIRGVFHSKDEGFRVDALQNDRPAVVRMLPEESSREASDLLSVVIRCGPEDDPACFSTESASESELLLTEECREVCVPPKSLQITPEDEAALVVQVLRSYRRDYAFENALDVALKIINQIELAEEGGISLRL